MSYTTHEVFGVSFTLSLVFIISIISKIELANLLSNSVPLWQILIASFFGALIPDLDHKSSKLGKSLFFISHPLKWLGVKHRGITHSFLGTFIFGIIMWLGVYFKLYTKFIWLGLILGFISHYIADMFNSSGVPLLFPLKKRFKFYTDIPLGGLGENLFVAFNLLLIGFIYIYSKPHIYNKIKEFILFNINYLNKMI